MTPVETAILTTLRQTEADRRGFYGVLSFQFRDGELVLIRKEETVMPDKISITKEELKKNG